jgi:hypothetical protein
VSFCDDLAEPSDVCVGTSPTRIRAFLTPAEHALLAQGTWSLDELISIAFLARRLAARLAGEP